MRKVQVPTGNLRVVRLDTYRSYGSTRQSWYDHKGIRCEEQLKEILTGFHELAVSIKARRAEDERKARERAEEARRQQEPEARQAAHAKLVKQLETDAGAWHRARYLRRYVSALRGALDGRSLPAAFRSEGVDFLQWAEHYVNQLDPLHPAPRERDFRDERASYYVNELERVNQAFARLLGSRWPHAWKVGQEYAQGSMKSERDSYGERSVFDVEASAKLEATDARESESGIQSKAR